MVTETDWFAVIDEIGPGFFARASQHDESDEFVAENYTELKQKRFFSAAVPADLGGGGVSHGEMCRLLRALAGYCPSTALCCSMHQHLIAAQVWNHLHDKPGRVLLERVAADELVLVSTGARDWLGSNGEVTQVDGGFSVSASKFFASGSPAGDIMITSAPYEDPAEGWQVLHFPVPFSADGVSLKMNWKAMGMRGTGSNTAVLDNVFVPAEAVALRRPRNEYHPLWSVVLTVALPMITAVYVGLAEKTAAMAMAGAKNRTDDPVVPFLAGELVNEVTTAQIAVDSMVDLANDYDFAPETERASAMVVRKTLATQAALRATEKALELTGGGGFFRASQIERFVRDAHAGQFHPLQAKRQQLFSGRVALGLDPIG